MQIEQSAILNEIPKSDLLDNVSYSNPIDFLSENERAVEKSESIDHKPMIDSMTNTHLLCIQEENYSNPIDLIKSTQQSKTTKTFDEIMCPPRPDYLELRGGINRPHPQR